MFGKRGFRKAWFSTMNEDWSQLGFNAFMTRSLQPSDSKYMSGEDFDLMTEDASLRSAKIGGNIRAKRIVVHDGVNDRVIIGYDKGGF